MWEFVKSGVDGNCELFGVNIFNYKWENTNQKIIVRDPIYNQEHKMTIYYAIIDEEEVSFAAGEFSNCVYGFYINKDE